MLSCKVSIAGLLVVAVLGCQSNDTTDATTCDRTEFSSYRTHGKTLAGDVDDDGTRDQVSVRFRVEVGPEAKRRWRELRGDPFVSCPRRVD